MTLEILLICLAILVGVALLLVEVFLLPGITIAGLAGGALLIGAIVFSYVYVGETVGHITLVSSGVLFLGMFVLLVKSKALNRIALNTQIKESVDIKDVNSVSEGDKGVTLSRLNPIGKILINNLTIEGKSVDGSFIDENERIEVVAVADFTVVVKRDNSGLN